MPYLKEVVVEKKYSPGHQFLLEFYGRNSQSMLRKAGDSVYDLALIASEGKQLSLISALGH